jgi:hypothetical protein
MAAGKGFKANTLPTAPLVYSPEHMRQFTRVLELYFSRLDAARNSAPIAPVTLNNQTGSFTVAPEDANSLLVVNSASPVNVTIPDATTTPLQIGTRFQVVSIGTGTVTIDPDTGVTISSLTGLDIAGQYGVAQLVQVALNVWVASGDLV